MKNILCLMLFAVFLPATVSSQALSADTSHSCHYHSISLGSVPFLLNDDPRVLAMVEEVCQAAGFTRGFEVKAASVASVTSLRDGTRYYLLYSKFFTSTLIQEKPELLYAILAHEIGHIRRRHAFDDRFRLSEESSADEFMGRVLYQLQSVQDFNKVWSYLEQEAFAYDHLYKENSREKIIRSGWDAEDGFARSENNLGYFDNEDSPTETTLPVFDLEGCPRFYEFQRSYFQSCNTLQEIDQKFISALHKFDYDNRRYYSIANGFVLITAMEQINSKGIALSGEERWKDYPVSANYGGILDYLKSLFVAKVGHFRLFAFVVTDQTLLDNHSKIDRKRDRDWLKSGGFWLPDAVAQIPYSTKHRVGVLIYEFEVNQSTNLLAERCNVHLLPVKAHLTYSGMLPFIQSRR